jgi:hypothetical protein
MYAMDTLQSMFAGVTWREVGAALAWELWGLMKMLLKLGMVVAVVVLSAAFSVLVLLLTGRLPWFVRRWL